MLKKPLDMGIPLHRGPTGEPGGDSLAGIFEKIGYKTGILSWTQRTLRL
jgi:hypothetical protein